MSKTGQINRQLLDTARDILKDYRRKRGQYRTFDEMPLWREFIEEQTGKPYDEVVGAKRTLAEEGGNNGN